LADTNVDSTPTNPARTRIILAVTALIFILLIFSCSGNSDTQDAPLDTNSIRTEAVATYASSLTKTLPANAGASPTPMAANPTETTPAVTFTLEPSPTANPCYNLLYINDVTIPDGTQMKAGEVFTKTWLVQNIGGCAWRAGSTLQNVGGEQMRGQTVTLSEAIQTGSKRELSVELVVPSGLNGLIQSSWRMADANGNFFGDTLTVNIVVGEIITPSATLKP